ncbi:MAG: nitrate reductase molybdenum cofactor assembly chaperone [Proteobacteria bacterium]|nr:nitrate reductase molybdenum cofactor assembly chaperone [Pseudomonadota bacterium]
MARTFRALAALLSYPTPDMQTAAPDIRAAIEADGLVAAAPMADLFADLAAGDIYDLQARYVDLFDRGRAVSLHLFEHVHGESRDRGQAMADLVALYADHGLQMQPVELPDYLPLFLEFLSLLPLAEARALLSEPSAILRMLADRLGERDAGYAAVMTELANLANAPATGVSAIPDDDPADLAALDAAWEEAAVRFGPGEALDGCGTDRLRTRMRAAQREVAAEGERR